MKVKKIDGSEERTILVGMITNDSVISQIATKWNSKEKMFKEDWCNTLGNMIVQFYRDHGSAPRKAIAGLVQAWATKNENETGRKGMEKILSQLNGRYIREGKEINPGYVVNLAEKHFNTVRIRKTIECLEGFADSGETEEAIKHIQSFGKIELGSGRVIKLLDDEEAWKEAFSPRKDQVLIEYPGALGNLFGNRLERDGFIAFLAPPKRGKTHWLIDVAWKAMMQRRRTLFFQIGDLSLRQLMHRFGVKATGIPVRIRSDGKKPIKVKFPRKFKNGRHDSLFRITKVFKNEITKADVKAARERVQKELQSNGKGGGSKRNINHDYMRVIARPNGYVGLAEIKDVIREEKQKGWIPDVVVIDYADLLKPPPGMVESREAINANWKALRGLSQEDGGRLVVTATQGNASSLRADSLTMSHFSEDKRKLDHVTGMMAINQDADEKEIGIMRLGWVALREEEYSDTKFCYVAGELRTGQPCIISTF
jgi:hypothetical protein